jgi:hypothetical protein
VKDGNSYVVVEGNTRVATYKLLTGQIIAPEAYKAAVPLIGQAVRESLLNVDVTIAPSRDSLMKIMARSHFGRGEKSRWRYLGSRKALHDDWKAGPNIEQLSNVFGRSQSQIRDYLIEYMLYLDALSLTWTSSDREFLLKPSLEFNPPVRFLQSTGHKQLVGIELDRVNLKLNFTAADAKAKFKHLIKRMVIDDNGPSATASYADVFADFVAAPARAAESTPAEPEEDSPTGTPEGSSAGGGAVGDGTGSNSSEPTNETGNEGTSSGGPTNTGQTDDNAPKRYALFGYAVTRNDLTLRQVMKEAKGLNTKQYPAAGSALLRSVIEVVLKLIIENKRLNPQGKSHDIESALNLVIGQGSLGVDDTRILREFKSTHLPYTNLSTHATVVPNHSRLMMARDCIDPFIKRNV